MLADIHPGPGSSGPRDFFLFQDQLYFLANDGQRGYELWRTDGTAAGTEFFVETWPGIDALIDNVAVGDTKFFFTASDGQHGSELWESDGTRDGTRMTEDLVEGLPSPPMRLLLPDGDEVYFQVDQTISPSLVGESFTGKWDGSQMTVVRTQSELWTNPRFMEIWNDELLIVGFRATHVGTTQLLATRSTPIPPRFLSSGELILASRSNLLFVPSPTQKTPISTLAVEGFETVVRHVFYWRRQGSSMNLIRWNSDLDPDGGEVLLQDFEVVSTKHHGDSLLFLTRGEGDSVDVWGLQEEGPAQKWGELAHEPREFVLNGNDLIYIARKDGALDETVYRVQLNRPLEGPDLVDALFAAVAANETDPLLDRNDDGAVDEEDIDYLFTQELQTNRADLNLDGTVDFGDFLILSANFGKTSGVRWSLGDIDNDNNVGFADFLFLSAAFGAE